MIQEASVRIIITCYGMSVFDICLIFMRKKRKMKVLIEQINYVEKVISPILCCCEIEVGPAQKFIYMFLI